ncbi:MAG: hypothetical protein HOQ32_07905 [Lysobacter sp.]|nr:hypothetical protein [Lysobacter sp.]
MKDATKAALALALVPTGWLILLFGASVAVADLQEPTDTQVLLKPILVYSSQLLGIASLGASFLLAIKVFRSRPVAIFAGLASGSSLGWIGWTAASAL